MMQWFSECDTEDDGKRRYRELAMEYHPDRGGSTQTMQEITAAFEVFLRRAVRGQTETARSTGCVHSGEYYEVLSSVITSPHNFKVETVGDWIWVFDAQAMAVFSLTMLGFQYSKKHNGMYWIDPPARSVMRVKTDMTLDEIRARYGSDVKKEKRYVS